MTVFRPRRLVLVCRVAALLLISVFGILAVLLPRGTSGGQVFGPGDQIGFFGIGLLLTWAVLRFTRVRVAADEAGIRIRNYGWERFLAWQVVAGVRLDSGSSWASLDLHDDDTVALLGIQANDGSRAVDAVIELRRLLAASRSPGGSSGQSRGETRQSP